VCAFFLHELVNIVDLRKNIAVLKKYKFHTVFCVADCCKDGYVMMASDYIISAMPAWQ